MDRRCFLLASTAVALSSASRRASAGTAGAGVVEAQIDPDAAELQRRTFDWFVHVTDPLRGLTPDQWPTPSAGSVGAAGLALTCWPIGVERGWMTRTEARSRTLNTMRFFHGAPQGPEAGGVVGDRGVFYGLLDLETGHRQEGVGLSIGGTALLLGGMLFAARWFDAADEGEAEIRRLAQAVYDRADWAWAVAGANRTGPGWKPETGFVAADPDLFTEDGLGLLLAIGSQTHPVRPLAWDEWCSAHDRSWTHDYGPAHLGVPALVAHQGSHVFVDWRGIRDAWLRRRSDEIGPFDYFENSRRAVAGQRAFAVANPGGWDGYSDEVWGLGTCEGPGDFLQIIDARACQFRGALPRGPGGGDDGTLAPAATMASYPFAPREVATCLKAMKARYGESVLGEWGVVSAFNPTLTEREGRLQRGAIVPGAGWVANSYRGTGQGAIVAMIENARSELVWRHMRDEPNLTRGLRRAGFTGGWLEV